MGRSERGIGLISIIILLLVLATVVFVGWRFYGPKDTAPDGSAATAKTQSPPRTYTDSAGRFTFKYPADWYLSDQEEGGKDGVVQPAPDWTKQSRPVKIRPAFGAENNDVMVTPGCSTESINQAKEQADQFHTQKDMTINGYRAFYDKLAFKGDAEAYLHHRYFVLHGEDCVEFSYRENWHHAMSDTDFDDIQNMPGFRQIVNSIKFTES